MGFKSKYGLDNVENLKKLRKIRAEQKRLRELENPVATKVRKQPKDKTTSKGRGLKGCSTGERIIEKYLKSKNIDFVMEKTFSDCKNPMSGLYLRYDFFVETHNLLIEFHGIQHYKLCRFNNTFAKLADQKYRDKLKIRYAKKKGIKLITFPYHVQDFLQEKLDEIFKLLP